MKNGFSVFIAAFIALGASWCGFVLAPMLQLGMAKQTTVLNSSDTYPIQRTGDATLGLQVYRANGCAACHTEQIQQSGFACNVVLTGTNSPAVSNLVSSLKLTGITKDQADIISTKIGAAGGKSETHIVATGADISRGWGTRHSVAADFLWDDPVQLGSVRVGPDLADVGARLGNAGWQLQHLYSPQSLVKNSAMPPFHFLFELKKIDGSPSPDALNLPLTQMPQPFLPPPGYEIIPTEDAKNLAAYLLSLRADVPLYEAPFTQAQPSTNSPAK